MYSIYCFWISKFDLHKRNKANAFSRVWVPNLANKTWSLHEAGLFLGPRSVRLAKDDTDKAGGQPVT